MTNDELARTLKALSFRLASFQPLAGGWTCTCSDNSNRRAYHISRTASTVNVEGPEPQLVEKLTVAFQPEQPEQPTQQPRRRRKHGTQEDNGGA